MVQLFALGDTLLRTLLSLGDFLINTTFGEMINEYDLPLIDNILGQLGIGDFTVAELIIGAGLTFILGFKIVKFFVGMFT